MRQKCSNGLIEDNFAEPKFKALADDKLYQLQTEQSYFEILKKNARKGERDDYYCYFLFPQHFQKFLYSKGRQNKWLFSAGLTDMMV